MTKIKICGLKTYEDAMFTHRIGADALGFVIDVPVVTPRKVSLQAASAIIARLPPYAITVGVVIPSSHQELVKIIEETRVAVIQVHGACSSLLIPELKKTTNVKIIRCYPIDSDTEISGAIETIEKFIEENADGILLDTKGEENTGGTGRQHDWRKSREIKDSFSCPFILAGGLNPENVLDAIRMVEPYAVDVASGVESSPGIKDRKKIEKFIQTVRNV
ncbi:MAG: phosphoribosylanthranilate isomerase [Candidatus Helarchaeota archaeon]